MRSSRAALVAVLVIGALGTSPDAAKAYVLAPGAYSNAAIADGEITACFQNNTPPYTHRSILMAGLRKWGDAIVVAVESNGRCDDDGSNVEVLWAGAPYHPNYCSTYAGVPIPAPGTYATTKLVFNPACGAGAFWWGGTNPVPNGQIDAYSTAIHEMGHAYGLAHASWLDFGNQVMDESTPCILDSKRITTLSSDDAGGIRARYPGLPWAGTGWWPNHGCID